MVRDRLEKADKAEKLREPIIEVEKLLKSFTDFQDEYNKSEQKTSKYKSDEESAKAKLDAYIKNFQEDEYKSRISELENKKELYKNIDQLRNNAEIATSIKLKAKKKTEDQKTIFNQFVEDAVLKYNEYNEAYALATDYRNRYFKGIYGEIADKLSEGIACPVCGSTHHPALATKLEDSISRDMMEEAEQKSEDAKFIFDEIDQKRKDAEDLLKKYDAELQSADSSESIAKALYEEKTKELVDGITSYDELTEKIQQYRDKIDAYLSEKAELETLKDSTHDQLNKHIASLETKKENCDVALQKYHKVKNDLDALLKEYGYQDIDSVKAEQCSAEERKLMQERINTYVANRNSNEEDIKKQKRLLVEKIEPDIKAYCIK